MNILKIKILTGDSWYRNIVGQEFYVDIDNKYVINKIRTIDDYYVAIIKGYNIGYGIKLGHTNYKQLLRKQKLQKISDENSMCE